MNEVYEKKCDACGEDVIFCKDDNGDHVPFNVKKVKFLIDMTEYSTGNEAGEIMEGHISHLLTCKNRKIKIKKELPKVIEKGCPECGSNMRLIDMGTWQFYGCSNYPTCTGTKKVR